MKATVEVDVARPEWLKDMTVLGARPGDTIVIRLAEQMPEFAMEDIRRQMKDVWPSNKVVVLAPGMELAVVRQEGA